MSVAQLKLWDYATARATDPPTSWEAARSVVNLSESQEYILWLLKRHGPMTDDQVWDRLCRSYCGPRISRSGARTRRAELVVKGLMEDSGKLGVSAAGRKSILWRAT